MIGCTDSRWITSRQSLDRSLTVAAPLVSSREGGEPLAKGRRARQNGGRVLRYTTHVGPARQEDVPPPPTDT